MHFYSQPSTHGCASMEALMITVDLAFCWRAGIRLQKPPPDARLHAPGNTSYFMHQRNHARGRTGRPNGLYTTRHRTTASTKSKIKNDFLSVRLLSIFRCTVVPTEKTGGFRKRRSRANNGACWTPYERRRERKVINVSHLYYGEFLW